MPCLNEAETLAVCIQKAHSAINVSGLPGEVLIADNGSTDGSQQIALHLNARVIAVPTRGYGAALNAGIEEATTDYILMADADDSYDFSHLDRFLEALDQGADLVMGNRFKGEIKPGAMPPLHRYLGNPALSFAGRLFFGIPIGDFHCGIRAFRRDRILSLRLRTTGMEFASEMVVKARLLGLHLAEVPTTLSPDGRSRPPHLRTWRDGWRHLRFLLMYSPRWLFFYPGLIISIVGLLFSLWLLPAERHIGRLRFDVDSLIYALGLFLIGVHIIVFAVSAKIFGTREGFLPANASIERIICTIPLEAGLMTGILLILAGISILSYELLWWRAVNFGALDPRHMLRLTLPSATALMLGVEIIFSSFFLGMLQIPSRQP